MLAPYRAILTLPGALRFSAFALLARAEIAMVSLGAVLLVRSTTGSYAAGGAVAATFGVASAVVAPAVGRLVDARGQAVVLRLAVPVHAVLLAGLDAAAVSRAPLPLLLVLAAGAGATELSIGSLVRARWAVLLTGTPRLQTAFALESVLDEVVFIVGPVVVVLLATLVSPAVGLLLAAATALAGGLLLAAQRGTEPPAGTGRPQEAHERRPVLRMRGLVVLVLVFLGLGGVFGASEVTVAAVTKAAGAAVLAGPVLSLWALGSGASGFVWGAIAWRSRIDHRFVLMTVLLAATTVPMLLSPVAGLPLVFLVAGVVIAPVGASGAALTEALVPSARLTEGLAWTNTALSLTYALSAAAAGALIDGAGPRAGFLVPITAGVVAAAAALLGARRLRPVTPLERAAA